MEAAKQDGDEDEPETLAPMPRRTAEVILSVDWLSMLALLH
jgi:hypothetical protein